MRRDERAQRQVRVRGCAMSFVREDCVRIISAEVSVSVECLTDGLVVRQGKRQDSKRMVGYKDCWYYYRKRGGNLKSWCGLVETRNPRLILRSVS